MTRVLPFPQLSRVALVMFAMLAMVVSAGCKDDPTRFSVIVTSDSDSIFRDGSNTATLTVTILSQAGEPPEVGSEFNVIAALGGTVADGGQVGTYTTDLTGSGFAQVRCDDTNDFLVVSVAFGSETGDLVIPCVAAPPGDWEVEYLGSTPDPLEAGDSGQLSFRATTADGAPVPIGTRITVTILGGNVVLANGSREAVVTTRSGDGRITIPVQVPDELQTSTICAGFYDPALGRIDGCAIIGSAQRSCTAVFNPDTIPSDGVSTSSLSLTVIDGFGSPVPGAVVDVRVTDAGDDAAKLVEDASGAAPSDSKSLQTGVDGRASIFVQAGTQSGSASMTATAAFEDVNQDTGNVEAVTVECEFSNDLILEPPPECFFQPIEIVDGGDRLGTSGSVYAQTATIRACFRDINGDPVPSGEPVRFTFPSSPAGYALVPQQTTTGFDGCASTQLQTGDAAGLLNVEAALGTGEYASTCLSTTIEVQDGSPVTQGWSFTCDRDNIAALIPPERGLVTPYCEIGCTTDLVDRRGNRVDGDAYPISFLAEQGAISDASFPVETGRIAFQHQVNGEYPYQAGAVLPGVPGAVEECNNLDPVNPRCQTDNLVSFIAYTTGQEFFCDKNGNGTYDEGEPYEDLGEPWVDIDENGVYDAGIDLFADIDGEARERNGVWDGPNSTWDRRTQIFAAHHLLYSGRIGYFGYPSIAGPINFVAAGTVSVSGSGATTFGLYDSFKNPIAGDAEVTFTSTCTEGAGGADYDFGLEFADSDAMPFTVRRERVHYDASGNPIPIDATQSCTDPRVARWETRYVVDFAAQRNGPPSVTITHELREGSVDCEGTLTVTQRTGNGCDTDYSVEQSYRVTW